METESNYATDLSPIKEVEVNKNFSEVSTSASSGPSNTSSPFKSEKDSNDLSPTKEDEVNKNLSEATTLKKKDMSIQTETGSKDGESVDKTDSVYLHKPPLDKMERRENKPEDEGACMEFMYSGLVCLDSCAIL